MAAVAAYAQPNATLDTPYQVKYASNLTIGDSVINITTTPGLAAWGTTIHANTSAAAGTYAVTETAFTPSTLSAGEFARLQYGCGVVANVGSGFGVCNSCRLGGLGSARN